MMRDVRELAGMVPAELAHRAFDCLPGGVRRRAVASVLRGERVAWALAYSTTRYVRDIVWRLAR